MDPDDPRAPTQAVWDAMTDAERARVVAALPSEIPSAAPPEGDPHRKTKAGALDALGRFFRRTGRRVYLSSELAVYYPGERMFAPDLMAVLDVDDHDRNSWVVGAEGKGLDFVIEVHVAGDARKDHERNVERYARLGISEYFIFDRGRLHLKGMRLVRSGQPYQSIVPQGGLYASSVLGLDLAIQERRLRFLVGGSPLAEAEELIGRLEGMLDELIAERDEERVRAEAERERADAAEAALAELRAELERRGSR